MKLVFACFRFVFKKQNETCINMLKLNLNSPTQDWSCTNGKNMSISATVPGQVTMDLVQAGKIGDPYHRYNDTK